MVRSHGLPVDDRGRTAVAERIVNAAGPWASRVAKLYGRELPVRPVPRQVFLLLSAAVEFEPEAFVLDYAQDLYDRWMRRDGVGYTLVRWSDPAEVPRIHYRYAGEAYYRRHVKRRIVRGIPALASAELGPGWRGTTSCRRTSRTSSDRCRGGQACSTRTG